MYGCHNALRPTADTSYPAQDGYMHSTITGVHLPTGVQVTIINPHAHNWIKVKHAMSTDCQYTKTTRDHGCDGCKHQLLPPTDWSAS